MLQVPGPLTNFPQCGLPVHLLVLTGCAHARPRAVPASDVPTWETDCANTAYMLQARQADSLLQVLLSCALLQEGSANQIKARPTPDALHTSTAGVA